MGAEGPRAEVWTGRRTVAEKAAGLGAVLLFGSLLGGPAVLKTVAGGFTAVGAIATLGLLVPELRAKRREAGERSGIQSPGGDGVRAPTAGLDEVPGDAHVVFVSYARDDELWARRFATMLTPLGQRGVVVWWDDGLGADVAWRPELARAVERSPSESTRSSQNLMVGDDRGGRHPRHVTSSGKSSCTCSRERLR